MVKKIFPGNYKSLEDISNFAIQQAENGHFSPNAIYEIQTAVEEACANIIDHAYGGEGIGDIEIQINPIETGLRIEIWDKGKKFNPDEVPEPDITSPLEIRKERGLGVYFIRKLMDEVVFSFSQSKGNKLTLIKYWEG